MIEDDLPLDDEGEGIRIENAREDYSTSTGFIAFAMLVLISFMFSLTDMERYSEAWVVVYIYVIHTVLFAATMTMVIRMFSRAHAVIPVTKFFVIFAIGAVASTAFVAWSLFVAG